MIEHLWSVLSSRVLTDSTSNNVSLIDILEQIAIPAEPPPQGEVRVLALSLVVASLWRRKDVEEPVKGEWRLLVQDPEGKEILQGGNAVDLSSRMRIRTLANLAGLPVTASGTYRFIVQVRVEGESEWQVAARLPLEIQFSPEDSKADGEANNDAPNKRMVAPR